MPPTTAFTPHLSSATSQPLAEQHVSSSIASLSTADGVPVFIDVNKIAGTSTFARKQASINLALQGGDTRWLSDIGLLTILKQAQQKIWLHFSSHKKRGASSPLPIRHRERSEPRA